MMRQEFRIDQRMQQRIVMTPMLQQALKILQMSTLELQEWVEQEMVENPVLEEEEEAPPKTDVADSETEELLAREEQVPGLDPSVEKALDSRSVDTVEQLTKKSPAMEEEFWEHYDVSEAGAVGEGEGGDGDSSDQEKRDFAEASVSREQTLAESLEWQLSVSALPEEDRPLALAIIGNLDENGYLPISVEDIAKSLSADPERVERALKTVQALEPSGVAGRNLRECLLLQLETRKGPVAQRAYEVVRDYFDELEKRKFPQIVKALRLGNAELQEILDYISSLDPKPGRNYSQERTKYVTPDVAIQKVDDEWILTLTEENMPRLRVSPYYRKLLKNRAAAKGTETRLYLENKIQSALWLIKNIEQRRKTLYRVSEAIFQIQRDFLEYGVSRLKPLTLKQVADIIGMHESTVSRVTTHKYVQTPRGLYELKYFFTSGLESEQGLDISSMSVKELIKEMVTQESSQHPHSDQKLAELLREKGIQIARRTVAKYREELRLSSASHRRKL
jgi:RNA polymerase sigma-54 factor